MDITCVDCGTVYFRVKSGGTPSKRCPECRVKHRKAYNKAHQKKQRDQHE